jgi:hypothetical protein
VLSRNHRIAQAIPLNWQALSVLFLLMPVLKKLFAPISKTFAAFFKHDVGLRRSERGLEVVLQERRKTQTAGGPRRRAGDVKRGEGKPLDAKASKERDELALMLSELDALLAEQTDSRQTLRHLAFVQQTIQKRGVSALHKVPLDVLQRALGQLESLVTNWTPVGLANLRSKMAVAIIDREHMDPNREADAYQTAAILDSGIGHPGLPEVEVRSDDEAIAAAYAALSGVGPVGSVEWQAELGSQSAKAVAPPPVKAGEQAARIEMLELQK